MKNSFLNTYVHDDFNLYHQRERGVVCQDTVEAVAVTTHKHF